VRRRTLLSLCGLGACSVSGCAGQDSQPTYGARGVDTRFFDDDVLTASAQRPADALREPRDEYHAIVDDETAAETTLVDDSSSTSFIDGTNFDRSYLVVVQNMMPHGLALRLDDIARQGDVVHLDISVASQPSGYDVLEVSSLLVRVTDEDERTPDEASVTISGYDRVLGQVPTR